MIKSWTIFIAFTLAGPALYAQHLSGIVLDRNTLLPLYNTTVSTPRQTVFSSVSGRFTLTNIRRGDTIKISCIGYQSHFMVFSQPVADTIRIFLEQAIRPLNSVVIIGRRPSNTDSIILRKEFGNVFNYQGTTIKELFITHPMNVFRWNDFITSSNNMTTLLSVNLLSVVNLLNKNSVPVTKLQKMLISDEQNNYVDQVFSKPRVIELTKLKGDSLQTFMDKYRPAASQARSMSDYQMMLYIKQCYSAFTKP